MWIYILISIVLLWITGYLFFVHDKLKQSSVSEVAEKDRPHIDKDSFFFWLEKGVIEKESFVDIIRELSVYVYGEKQTIYAILIALLSKWHLLLQGAPGTWKTTLVRILAQLSGFSYARIQCTPDLLPQDVIWTEIYDSSSKNFKIHYWPVVTNLLHIDEINRATPKLQSAFLEVMQEKSISIGKETKILPDPFFVIATQNPYDAIGTYMLPYGQLDRFMLGVYTSSLDKEEEYELLKDLKQQWLDSVPQNIVSVLDPKKVLSAQDEINKIKVPDDVLQHAVQCIYIAKKYASWLSTRASKSLLLAAKAWAFLQNKDSVEKKDIDAVLSIVLRHRISYLLWKDIDTQTLYRIILWDVQKDDIAML